MKFSHALSNGGVSLEAISPYLSSRTKLKRNKKSLKRNDFVSLGVMLIPGVAFGVVHAR